MDDSGDRTIAYVGDPNSATSCGLVVQRIGRPARVVVSGLGMKTGSFTPAGNLVYITQCQDRAVCADVEVTYESNVDGSEPTLIDGVDHDCRGGNLCRSAVIGAPSGRGWVQEWGVIPDEIDVPESCFQGGYQKAGTVTNTSPSLCLQNAQAVGFDVA